MNEVGAYFDYELLRCGIRHRVTLNFEKAPHFVIVGASGSGKSMCVRHTVAKIAQANSDALFVVVDYKTELYPALIGCPGFYGFEDSVTGIQIVFDEMNRRMRCIDAPRTPLFLVLDEYSSLLLGQEKVVSERIKRQVASILNLGRSLSVFCIISVQRADAAWFEGGCRLNISNRLLLGHNDREQIQMLVPDYKGEMAAENQQGEGYLYRAGKGICRVKVPFVSDPNKLEAIISRKLWQPEENGVGEA